MTAGWLAAAVVLVPLVGGVLVLQPLYRSPRVDWALSALIMVLTFVGVGLLTLAIGRGEVITYQIAGVPATHGVELVADGFSILVILLDVWLAMGVLVYVRTVGPRSRPFLASFLLLVGGTLGMVMAGDLFTLYVFLEIVGIAAYALVATADSRHSTYAAFKYLLLGTMGAVIYLLGVGYAFMGAGTLNMTALGDHFATLRYGDPLVVLSFVMITIGLAVKIALFPVHTWLADAHAAAPDAVSAIISGLVPAVAVYAYARILFTVYSVEFLATHRILLWGVIGGATLSLLMGNVYAIFQRDVKLMLAFSTVSQFGLVVLGIAVANDTALTGAIVQMFGHGVVKGALFLLAGVFAVRYGATTLESYAGLAKRSPLLGVSFVVLGISMIGLPPTVGFVGKWYIALGAAQEGMWVVTALVVVSTVLTMAYVVPFIDRLYFHGFEESERIDDKITPGIVGTVVLAAILAIAMGLSVTILDDIVAPAVESLLT